MTANPKSEPSTITAEAVEDGLPRKDVYVVAGSKDTLTMGNTDGKSEAVATGRLTW